MKSASLAVEGQIRIYRAETALPAELRATGDEEPALPLISSGYLWRQGERLRVECVVGQAGTNGVGRRYALAIDPRAIYEFIEEAGASRHTLNVYRRDTPPAHYKWMAVSHDYFRPLEALWNAGAFEFADLPGRLGARWSDGRAEMIPGGLAFDWSQSRGADAARIEFEPAHPFPFGYLRSSSRAGASTAAVEQRATSETVGTARLPSRLVEVATFGESGGQTHVVRLDLKPLDVHSPGALGLLNISADSLTDTGLDYQIYYYGDEAAALLTPQQRSVALPGPELPAPVPPPYRPSSWAIILFVAYAAVAGVVLWLASRGLQSKRDATSSP